MIRKFFVLRMLIFIIFVVNVHLSFAQVWQWSVPVRNAKENNGASHAFLWIPENCKKIRGVIVAQNNMEEQSILESKTFRDAMSKLGFAEIWVLPSFDHLFRFNEGAGETFDGMMNDLADVSGYTELKHIAVVPIGHSAAASWPYYFAAWNPQRTLCAISVSGQWPYFRNPVFAPEIWGDKNIDYVPCLETMGEYEAANIWSTEGLKERTAHPLMPLSMLACPAEGHFAATEKKIAYIALYIKKAAQYRLIKGGAENSPAILKPIDPTKTGWLADKWRFNQTPTAPAAPVGKYTGDTTNAFWFFDEEIAKATEAYQAAYRNMKAELLGYVQDGKIVEQKNVHQQVDLKFEPYDAGITFKLTATFLDTVPGAHQRTSEWTGFRAGLTIGHAMNNNPISIVRIAGPFEKINDSVFCIRFEKDFNTDAKSFQLWFAATHEGDDEYKPAVQQAQMIIPAKNTEGVGQHISFPKIGNQKAGTKFIQLNATSDANVPVYYFVKEGPAEIDGNVVKFTKIPPRSKFPVRVTIVAWQYGRSIDPKIRSAEPVEQSFFIVK